MQVILSRDAKKQYDHLSPKERNKVKKKLISLETNPFSGKKLAGELAIYRSLRAWPYRIIYFVNEKQQQVEVIDIEHGQGVYK